MKPHLKKIKGMWNCYGRGARAADVCPKTAYLKWWMFVTFGWAGLDV